MSVSELIKTALPVAATQSDAASMGTPTKICATLTTATTTLPINSNSGTPHKFKNQAMATTNTEKVENMLTPTTTATSSIQNTNSNILTTSKAKTMEKTAEEFNKDLQIFHEKRGTPIAYMPKISGRLVDLLGLYNEVTERGGFHKVNTRDEWDEVLPVVGLRDKCVNACAAVKHIYRRFLEKYERLTFFGEDPDKIEAMEAADALESGRSRSSRYPSMHAASSSNINAVPMSYNYRQHIVNMERRRTFRLSTDLHKHSNYEKLMLSLISPLPNEQDFAINVCTLMANESKLTLKLNEYPKLLNLLLAHAGVFADCTLRQLFQEMYARVRKTSLYGFWRDLLHYKPQILELYTDEQALRDAGLIMDINEIHSDSEQAKKVTEYLNMDFFNLGRGHGTQDAVGQRVQQIINILRNLSFFEEHLTIYAKNRTLLRFLVMSANVRWGTLHIQALDIIGNMAMELELMDPSLDDLSRILMGTLCDGIEGEDRAVIINCLEILYKLCQKESNEDYINKCLNLKFYETICLFLSLNDIMLLIFTLETIYALTSMGARSCHIIMQVRGIIDQLVSLISVEAQAYGPDGCILMRVVETVPGNMLPMVAQNIANLQNVQQQQQQQPLSSQTLNNNTKIQQPSTIVVPSVLPQQQQQQLQQQQQQQLPQQQLPLPKLSQSTAAAAAIILQQQAQILQQPLSQTNQATLQLQQQQQQQQQHSQIVTSSINNNDQQKTTNFQQQQIPLIKPTLPTIHNSQLPQQQLIISKPQSPAPVINQQIPQNTPTLATTSSTSTAILSTSSNQFTQDDEQYALAWLAATFERAGGVESRIEQQDLYRMYLTHSQKAGKHSVVNKMQFPRLVRIIFGNNIGPAIVRRADGTEYSGVHYVAIKMRAHPLPIQIKMNQTTTAANTPIIQQNIKTTPELKKIRKKPLLQQSNSFEDMHTNNSNNNTTVATNANSTTTTTPTVIRSSESSITSTINSVATNTVTTDVRPALLLTSGGNHNNNLITTTITPPTSTTKPIITSNIQLSPATTIQQQQQQSPPPLQQQQQQFQLQQPSTSSSSLIKSLLANKVNQRQQKQKEQIITQTTGTINQQQQQQQQKPIKVTSNSISALVNNPLMQNTPVKVGQTTIKPLNPQLTQIDKKQQQQQQQQQQHSTIKESSVPPPLAPLSGNNVVKDTSGRSMIIANQMLVDILDKKTSEPPLPTTIIKRKMMDDGDAMNSGQTIKRLAYDANGSVIAVVASTSGNNNNNGSGGGSNQITPSKNAANLYAEMAASILEDEDLEDIPTLLTHSGGNNNNNNNSNPPIPTPPPAPAQTPPQSHQQQSAIITIAGDVSNNQIQQQQQPQQMYLPAKIQQNVPRQILFQTNATTQQHQQQQQQLKLTGQPTAMATIKTDQGLQTVPVILQQKPMDPSQPQFLIQPQQQATHTTQYVLATNQQGQTYLVAQQIPTQPQPPPPQPAPTQTMLLTQTPQHGAGTKTIIIVQQQQQQQQQNQQQQSGHIQQQQLQGTQKMIMTTHQGQQVLLTQRTSATTPTPPPPPSPSTPIIINPGTGVNTLLQRQFQQQPTSGQISPTLLSQLNHIPATIKLHQPSVICSTSSGNNISNNPTTATITRVAKPLTAMPMQIPQLQQHSSIIQQHIISGGVVSSGSGVVVGAGGGSSISGDKRQVILSGGRAIEIKETVITNTSLQSAVQQHTQSALLNSQTIITHSPRPSIVIDGPTPTTTSSSVLTTPTTTTPSIIQQKISNITTNAAGSSSGQIKPTLNVATSSSTQSSTAQVIVTQSPMGKKPGVITHRPLTTGVIKSNSTIVHSGVTGSCVGNGPPPLAVQSSKVQAAHGQDKLEDLPKTPTLTKTPTPPLLPTRTPTPANTNTTSNNNNNNNNNNSTTPAASAANNLPPPPPPPLSNVDINWLYVCDWRNCPRRKFKSLNDLQQHACTVHCPEHLDPAAEIFCQWGIGPGLCDGIPRKRYSLMTHLIDRHITMDALRQAVQRRISAGANNLLQPTQPPVTIIRNLSDTQRGNSASPALSSSSASSSSVPATGSSALQAIQRHTADFVNSKELMDENEGPVTKSIRLTAALILRNLVTYTNPAKRTLRRYEQHLSNIALSNVESSGTIAHILFELNN